MSGYTNLVEVTADGTVTSNPSVVTTVVGTAASGLTGTGTVTVRDGGSSGTVRLIIKMAAGESVPVGLHGAAFFTDVHVTLDGTGVTAYVEYV